ncbi:MAG TPA: hypothetical protein PKE31_09605 [Pseudomonadota bacterium]|nr:hypothetical protein [Pseudomonadota bacterium]
MCTSSACDAELAHDLPERHANLALLALRDAGILAQKQPSDRRASPQTFVLTVPRSQEAAALSVLKEQGLPKQKTPAKTSKLSVLPADRRTDDLHDKEAALEETLESLPQVSSARVHVSLADTDPLWPTAQLRPTASVLLLCREPGQLPANDLAELVAKAITGLDPKDVSVLTVVLPKSVPAQHPQPPKTVWVASLGALGGLLTALLLQIGAWLWQKRKPRGTQAEKEPNPLSS